MNPLNLLIGWTLFAFGGAYVWTTVPLIAGAIVLAAIVRPAIARPGARILDLALTGCLIVAAVQLVPLSESNRLALSPGLARVDAALYVVDSTATARPLTVDRTATMQSLALAIGVLALFWSARAILERGGVRRTVRAVSMFGLVASATAILQHATSPLLLYWTWRPVSRAASPYSPFVNKNDLAAWLVMAIPLVLGYLVSRVESRRREGLPSPVQAALDDTAVWLIGSLGAMSIALVVTLSRSGLTSAAAAMLAFVLLARGRMASRGLGWLLVGLGLLVLLTMYYANTAALMTRLNDALTNGVGTRRDIWAATETMIGDFWMTGVGVGAYARAMSVYQGPHLFYFNHAHDEYLQILAEGGVAMTALALTAVAAGAIEAARRLRADATPVFWIRAGAVSGAIAIAVQCIWETGLRMPANAVLFAVCCAVALHRPAIK